MARKRRSETAKDVALNSGAPAAERYDAQVDLHKSMGPRGLSDLIPRSDLQPVIDYINNSMEEADALKASRGQVVPFPAKNRGRRGGQSVFLDDFQIVAQGEYWDRPGALGFDSMRAMVDGTPILQSVILTRIRQVSRFCRVQTEGTGHGFTIKHVDKTVELNDEQQNSVKLLQGFMSNCGWEPDPRARKRLRRDSFAQFMAKAVRDTLTLDAMAIETEFKREAKRGLDGFYAVDGGSIRLCTEEGYHGDDEVFALQVIQGRIRTAYTYQDLVYEVRNPRTDVLASGYGYAETEMLIRTVTYLLNAMTFNGSFFDKNSIPRGVMHLSGNYTNDDIAAFKRYWTAMVKGINNVFNVPILVSKDQESKASFEAIGGQLEEMAFAKWLVFLTSIVCAIYGISPEEISMESFSAGRSSLSGSDTEAKIDSGSANGFRPLLSYFENVFTDFVIRPFSEQYAFRFTGLDDEDPKQRFEMRKLVTTWNEARQEEGYDPIKGKLGDAPMNQALQSLWMQEQQAQENPEDFGQVPEAEKEGVGPAADFGGGDERGDFGTPPAQADGGEEMSKAYGLPELTIYRLEP